MDGELKFGLSLSTIWETFSDIFWMVLISVAMVRAERSEKVAERRDMVRWSPVSCKIIIIFLAGKIE